MRAYLFFPFLALLGFMVPSPASAGCNPSSQICLGLTCDQVGATTMDYNQQNLLACLRDPSQGNNLFWKSMNSSSGGAGCQVTYEGLAGGPTPAMQHGQVISQRYDNYSSGLPAVGIYQCFNGSVNQVGVFLVNYDSNSPYASH